MNFFVDTSAFYALIDRDDANYARATEIWNDFYGARRELVTCNYIILETFALLSNRIGIEAARDFQHDLLPVVRIHWVTEDVHHAGVIAFFAAARRNLSLVDCVSFEVMRRLGFRDAFTFDPHFTEQGFRCLP